RQLVGRFPQIGGLHAEAENSAVERKPDPVCLIGSDDRHAFERTGQRDLISDSDSIVVPRNYLIVFGIWALDQSCKHCGKWRAETQVVVTTRDLKLLVGGKQSANLLECLRWDDQITG